MTESLDKTVAEETPGGLTSPGSTPTGVTRVVVINSAFAVVGLIGLSLQASSGNISPVTVFATVMWLCLGPPLLIKSPFTWRISRTLIYAYAMVLALLSAFAILRGSLLTSPVTILLGFGLVVYLIGVRGYLNSVSARAYYGVPPLGG